jgi:glycosyltransferase involved in cell wall biosynthesis
MEGFGLPVLESVARGKPCICSAHGALGEAARPGGCVLLGQTDAASLAGAMTQLLQDPAARDRLAEAARRRHFRTWAEYAADLLEWMQSLR